MIQLNGIIMTLQVYPNLDILEKCTAYLNTNYTVTPNLTIDTTNTVLTG